MKTKNILLPLLAVLLMSSCGETSTSPSPSENTSSEVSSELSQESSISTEILQVYGSVAFYQIEKTSELAHMKALILDNITDETLKDSITKLFDNCGTSINESNSVSEISELYKTCLTDVYNLIPTYDNTNESVELTDEEKQIILKLLDEYIYRNHLFGAPLADSDWGYAGINLNTLDKETWEKFFGENGTICQTAKENYWDVKPFMSNDNFIKGINLALDKSLFTEITPSGDGENPRPIIDISECDYYTYDVEQAKSYFKVALEEMVEQGIYDVSNLSEPINLTIEMAWDTWNSYNNYETYHNSIKTCLETVFNDESVTNGNFTLTVNAWQSEYFSQIYAGKIYVGQFDMCYGRISLSSELEHYYAYLSLSPADEFSHRLNVNWSLDTSSLDDCIVYNGFKYSYDDILGLITKTQEPK